MDCPHYENDEIMASLGRLVVDQYIAHMERHPGELEGLTGAASYIINTIAQYVEDEDEDDGEDSLRTRLDDNEIRAILDDDL